MFFYSNRVTLMSEAADEFLKDLGVEIFNDGDIAIGESIFDLETGCDILEKTGVTLCEDCILVEGELIDAAKAYHRSTKEMKKDARSDPEYMRATKDFRKDATNAAKQYLKDRRSVGKDQAKKNFNDNSGKAFERLMDNPGVKRVIDKHTPKMADDLVRLGTAAGNAHDKAKARVKNAAGKLKSIANRTAKNECTLFDNIEII